MIDDMKMFFKDLIVLCQSKMIYYASFFTLWTLFLLYNNNFFYPYYFWILYSILVLFIVPVYFIIAVEEKNRLVKILFAILFTASVCFAFYLIGLKGSKRNITRNEIINGLMIISALPIIIYSILKKRFFLSDFGFSFGKVKTALLFTLICSVAAVLIAYFASFNPQFKHVYPLIREMKSSTPAFIRYEIGFFLFFFLWEFFFRGAMLFAFIKSSDNIALAIILQSAIFAFAHLGKPGLETISSLFGGLILGFLVYRIKTFMPAAIIHFVLALTMDVISVYFS